MARAYCVASAGPSGFSALSCRAEALAKIGVTITGREPISDAGERWYLEGAALPDLTGRHGDVLVFLEMWAGPQEEGNALDDGAAQWTSESGRLWWVKVTDITACPEDRLSQAAG